MKYFYLSVVLSLHVNYSQLILIVLFVFTLHIATDLTIAWFVCLRVCLCVFVSMC